MKEIIARVNEHRRATYDRAKRLVETIEAEKRDFTPAERSEWDELNAELQRTTERVRELEEAREQKLDMDEQRVRFEKIVRPVGAGVQEFPAGRWLAAELESRGLVGSGATGGGAYTPEQAASYFFDRLAAKSVGLRSGFRVIRTERDKLVVPRLTADVTSAWVAEAGTITSTDMTADQVTAEPKKLAAIEAMSNELIADSDPAILDVVGQSLIRSITLKLDHGFYEGSGTSPEIRGLKNVSGIQSVSMGTNGAVLANLDQFADAIGLLEQENAEATAVVLHPRTWQAILKLKEQTSGNNKPLIQDEVGGVGESPRRRLYGVPVFLSSQLSITETQGTATNASSAYVYQADQAVAVIRKDVRVELDRSRLFNSDQSELRAIMRADFVVPNVKAVCRIVGIIPA